MTAKNTDMLELTKTWESEEKSIEELDEIIGVLPVGKLADHLKWCFLSAVSHRSDAGANHNKIVRQDKTIVYLQKQIEELNERNKETQKLLKGVYADIDKIKQNLSCRGL